MDGWVSAKTAATMAYYDRADIPLHYELADTFTVCDAYHSSIHTSTSPNRNHLWSGWTGHEADGRRAVGNDAYDEGRHPGYTWPTYAERLEKAGRSWKTYTEWENFTDNNIEFFTSFKKIARKALAKARELEGAGDFGYMESFYAAVRETDDPAVRARLLAALDEVWRPSPPANARSSNAGCGASSRAPSPRRSAPTWPPGGCPRCRTWCRRRSTPSTPAPPHRSPAPASSTRCWTRSARTRRSGGTRSY